MTLSLRARLLLAISVIAIVALVVADFATYSALKSFLYDRVDQSLEQSHGLFERVLNNGQLVACNQNATVPNSPPAAEGPFDNGPPPNIISSVFLEVRTPNGAVVAGQRCSAYEGSNLYAPRLPNTITGFQSTPPANEPVVYFTASAVQANGPQFRVRASELVDGDQLVLAVPLHDTDTTLHQLMLIELAVTAGALLVALVGGWWLVRLGLRPLADAERTAEEIAAGNLEHRVPGENDRTEVGRLARALNVMLGRIEMAFAARDATEAQLRDSESRLRQFVADASHELRTPLAAVSAYAELFERGAWQSSEDLERIMGGIQIETARMGHLVQDLLTLARMDEGRPLERQPVELVALCAESVQTATTVGPAWPVRFWADRPVEVLGDPLRLRQVVDNLLANVRAHTPEGTAATVTLRQEGAVAVIEVTDEGPGMDPDEARYIFERFYRTDRSRSRAHGGSGLGLSIVAAIVAAHGGTVQAESAPGRGARFTVRLPAVPATDELDPAAPATSGAPTA
ncbi:MAG TPA: HAMP domain-containing sensor histidine kinase [Acidimicrobiales bacterium]|nr:HAMP domain-containing sensor histidine kinase [Acidimicrobiales bacterium]